MFPDTVIIVIVNKSKNTCSQGVESERLKNSYTMNGKAMETEVNIIQK